MAFGCDHSADAALQALSQSLPVPSEPAPGLLYLNQQASPHAEHILQTLRAQYPTVQWSGACGYSVVAGAHELSDMPAISAMILPLPANSWHEFSGQLPMNEPAAHTALVHADPTAPDLPALVSELASRTKTGYLFGGLTCGEPARAEQFCNGVSQPSRFTHNRNSTVAHRLHLSKTTRFIIRWDQQSVHSGHHFLG